LKDLRPRPRPNEEKRKLAYNHHIERFHKGRKAKLRLSLLGEELAYLVVLQSDELL
jgi:hypothetical protein